jgi:predicted ATP-grasp superfamily ATP-dependent carboligase
MGIAVGRPLMILGASARAAAYSAWRAGLRPLGIDLFADRDLRAIAPVRRIPAGDYPEGLFRLASVEPPTPWIFTGALENSPSLIARLAETRTLWGITDQSLRDVRDPLQLAEVLDRAGLPRPQFSYAASESLEPGGWLLKPRRSAGGRGIREWRIEDTSVPPDHIVQQRIKGVPGSAVYLAGPDGCCYVGATLQLLEGFRYRGSLGPWEVSPDVQNRLESLGRALTAAFRLVGLFGVDFVLRDEIPWPVEVNPRYTASMEVLELTLSRSLLAEHARCFDPDGTSELTSPPVLRPRFVGKAIVTAPGMVAFPALPYWRPVPSPWCVPVVADIPHSGEVFQPGQPVLTVFAQGLTLDDCRQRLERRSRRWRDRLDRDRRLDAKRTRTTPTAYQE